jgi:hypothetical protein
MLCHNGGMENTVWEDTDHSTWGAIGKNAELFIDKLTDREDVIVVVSPDLRSDEEKTQVDLPAGRFYPAHARININANLVFDENHMVYPHIDPQGAYTQRIFPRFVGTLIHEAAHAKHTLWDLAKAPENPHLRRWVTVLEEIRAERQMVDAFPHYADYIKVIVKTIVGGSWFSKDANVSIDAHTRFTAAHDAILILGREDYDVFAPGELDEIRNSLDEKLEGDLNALQAIWTEVYSVEDDDIDGLTAIAEKIQELIDPDNEGQYDDGAGDSSTMPCGSYAPSSGSGGQSGEPDPDNDASGTPKRGSGEGENGEEGDADRIAGKLAEIVAEAEKEIRDGFANRSYIVPESEHEKNERRRKEIQASAKNVTEMSHQAQKGRGYSYSWYYNSVKKVTPDANDVARMRSISEAIKRAHYRDVTRTVTPSQLPPGRFVVREAMNRRAQIDNGQAITATPWKQVRRRTVENPPITFGVLTDISGSMDVYQREVASFTWAMTNAVQKLHGSVGAIAWNTNNNLYEMVKPHSRISETIDYYTAAGGSDGLPSALKAIDGMLNLSFGEGVRMLAIITDGQLPSHSTIQKEIDYLANHGVVVVWICTSSSGMKVKNVIQANLKDPKDFGRIVGPKLVDALASYQG